MSHESGRETVQSDTSRERGVLWRGIRGALAHVLRFGLTHRAVGCLAPAVLLVVVGAYWSGALGRLGPRPERAPLAIVNHLETSPDGLVINEPASAVESYFRALARFDAAGVMATYHPMVRDDMIARGATIERLQTAFDEASRRGARIIDTRRLANVPLQDGRQYVFYIVTRSGFSASGGAEEIYFVFTLDPAGRILSIT